MQALAQITTIEVAAKKGSVIDVARACGVHHANLEGGYFDKFMTVVADAALISLCDDDPPRLWFLELDELGPEQRTVFIMHYREGFQINEIASVLEMAPGTVKSRLFYTRKYLAEKLQHFMDQIEF